MQSDETLRNETGRLLDDTFQGRLTMRKPIELRPHAAYIDICGEPSELKLNTIARRDAAWQEPVVITGSGTILDGHARWTIALRENRPAVSCIEYDLTQEDELRVILERHREICTINPYCRVLLALRIEPYLKGKVKRSKNGNGLATSSNLTKAEAIDVRKEIARISGVSTGNITKVKQILESAAPEVREALQRGTLRIHRAWKWRALSAQQQKEALWRYTGGKSIEKVVSRLVRQHLKPESQSPPTIRTFAQLLIQSTGSALEEKSILVADVPGYALVVTRELYQSILWGRAE